MKLNVPELEARVNSKLIKKFIHPTHPELIGWSYTDKCQYEKAWDEHTMNARGVITLPDGTIISRPFPKFFNLGEKEAEPIDWTEPVEITEKLDGSLIILSFYKGEMIVNSRGSFTSEHAEFARRWLHDHFEEWTKIKHSEYTYLFEAIFTSSNKNEVKVVNYGDKSDLTLLAVIHTDTGEELSYVQMKEKELIGKLFGISLSTRYGFDDVKNIISKVKARTSVQDGEGLVLHFMNSNKRVKVKSDVYIRMHRLISHANRKTILQMLMSGDSVEEVYSTLPDEFYTEVKKWVAEFTNEHDRIFNLALSNVSKISAMKTRKDQSKAIYGDPELKDICGIMFMALDGRNIDHPIWDLIKKQMKEKK